MNYTLKTLITSEALLLYDKSVAMVKGYNVLYFLDIRGPSTPDDEQYRSTMLATICSRAGRRTFMQETLVMSRAG
jgi:hypothetical protein